MYHYPELYIGPSLYVWLFSTAPKIKINVTFQSLYFLPLTYKTVVELRPADCAMSGQSHKGYLNGQIHLAPCHTNAIFRPRITGICLNCNTMLV